MKSIYLLPFWLQDNSQSFLKIFFMLGDIPKCPVTSFKNDDGELFGCCWNPTRSLLLARYVSHTYLPIFAEVDDTIIVLVDSSHNISKIFLFHNIFLIIHECDDDYCNNYESDGQGFNESNVDDVNVAMKVILID